MPANLENSAVAIGLKKVSFHSSPKDSAKECSNYCTIAVISQASKIMSKILQARFNSIWTENFYMYKLNLEKAEEPEIKLPTSSGSPKKQGNSKKTSSSASLTMVKPLTVWITTNCGKFFKRWEYQTTWPASWETCMQVKKQQLAPNMEQWTGSKLGKEHPKAVSCHPAYLTYIQSTSLEMPGWINHKLESRLPGETSTTSDMQMIIL